MKNMLFSVLLLTALLQFQGCSGSVCTEKEDLSIASLAREFADPSVEYGPYVWWHWMGSNFSKEGITKDLEAMKEAGIGGATIFNLTSAVMESECLMENNPWPEQTYRSEAYWDALKHAASEAQRLGMRIGLHNSPGYATTGGPWIDETKAMKIIVSNEVRVEGGRTVEMVLERPDLPVFSNWAEPVMTASSYWDIEVMAVPAEENPAPEQVLCISEYMDENGKLIWNAPEGDWIISRIGYAPTMSMPHPVPDELSGRTLEVDKFSREYTAYHWDQVLDPIVEHLGPYIGKSFDHILVDSYEAGWQNWTEGFRERFIAAEGYDPLPFMALEKAFPEHEGLAEYRDDMKAFISRQFIEVSWTVAREKINEAGLQFYIEPYDYLNQFDVYESAGLADVPMVEFWHNGDGGINEAVVRAAKDSGKRIVAAEAFTGRPEVSMYVEDPALLKHSADGALHNGANRFFLHHWVHQPFDDRYQPGMGMGWWGTHFGRNQTWIKPGKAFFKYLGRCQMLLQQGFLCDIADNVTHRRLEDADIFFVINPSDEKVTRRLSFDVQGSVPQLWNAEHGTIRSVSDFKMEGTAVCLDVTLNPDESVFVVFPDKCTYDEFVEPDYKVISETHSEVTGPWEVTFGPKLEETFTKTYEELRDFSTDEDERVRYFAGTAVYSKVMELESTAVRNDRRVVLDLGELNDIAEVWVNGEHAGVAWYPPYEVDITPYVKAGSNAVEIAVTNNWANRLIGDEQHPADFEWGVDRGESMGRAMKAFPEWFINGTPRPSEGRKTFNIWYYYRQDSALQPAGLVGPVRIVGQEIDISR